MNRMDDSISRQAAIDAIKSRKTAEQSSAGIMRNAVVDFCIDIVKKLPSAQPEREDYTEMKREFIRMAGYIDSLLVCSDEQKETLMNFISRLAEFMPWTERD